MSHRHLTFSLIRQFLKEEKYLDTLHAFEKESCFHFDKTYASELGMSGKWDEAEKYISSFISIDHTEHSMNIYFQIWQQKYLEALEKKDENNALKILQEDLKHIETFCRPLYIELTKLLTMDDFRKHPMLMYYKDTNSGRIHAVNNIIKIVDLHPLFREKLVLPNLGGESVLKNLLAWHKSQFPGSSSSHMPMDAGCIGVHPTFLQYPNADASLLDFVVNHLNVVKIRRSLTHSKILVKRNLTSNLSPPKRIYLCTLYPNGYDFLINGFLFSKENS